MNTVAFKMLVGRQRQQQGAVPVLVSSWSARMHLRGPRVPDEESEVVGSLLCALANAPEGGVVLLGAVHEGAAGHITGVEDLGAAETCLIWLCDQMVPPLDPECWVDEAGGRPVLCLRVEPVTRDGGAWFCPRGAERQRFRLDEGGTVVAWPWKPAAKPVRSSKVWPAPEVPPQVESHERQPTEDNLWAVSPWAVEVIPGWDEGSRQEQEAKLGRWGLASDGQLTVAGVVALVDDPNRRWHIREDAWTRSACQERDLRRLSELFEDRTRLPRHVLSDLLVNAIVHRSYDERHKGPIELSLSDARVVVESPGGPVDARMLAPNVRKSFCRNPVLHRFFRASGLIQRDSGLARIRRVLRQKRWALRFELEDDLVRVVLWKVPAGQRVPVEPDLPEAPDVKQEEHPFAPDWRHRDVLGVLLPGEMLRAREIAVLLGWPASTTRRVVREMVERGLLAFTEKNRNSPQQRVMRVGRSANG